MARKITIDNTAAGQRLDKFLVKYLAAAPKATIYKLLRKKSIKVNGAKATESYILNPQDTITFFLSDDTLDKFSAKEISLVPKNMGKAEIEKIYEDEYVLIVNKPANLLTQPNIKGGDSLIARIRGEEEGLFKTTVINRLDRNTTGIVVCAKTLIAAQILSELFRRREIEKYYIGIVHGKISDNMILEATHIKDEANNLVEYIGVDVPRGTQKNKISTTEIIPMAYNKNKDISIIKIKLITGHSHQIRAHLKFAGYPLVGDPKYGLSSEFSKAKRQQLHAHEIKFPKMQNNILQYLQEKTFKATIPPDFIFHMQQDV
ncbi:MAG: RluA family pseudouridine synthase [Defluviitaleaceae bacterium]|nr:RluA family pseudouridine synthase [Defluviitaleaceae bacterium]